MSSNRRMSARCLFLLLFFFYIKTTYSAPNILIFIADDLGIGDIGCYGNNTIRTPNIDRLCREGVKLTHHIAAAPVCGPSRAAFYTGRYPVRYGMLGDKGTLPISLHPMSRVGLPRNETTWMNVLQKQGYRTHLTGKWHVGFDCDDWWTSCRGLKRYGLDSFYGLPFSLMDQCESNMPFFRFPEQPLFWQGLLACICGTLLALLILTNHKKWVMIFSALLIFIWWFLNTHAVLIGHAPGEFSETLFRRFSCVIARNSTIVEQPLRLDGLAQRLSLETQKFLRAQQPGQPFALIHSFAHVHTPMFTHPDFKNKSVHGRYGDNVEEMDWQIGIILEELEKTGLASNTIVYFFSDHGGHIEIRDENGQRVGGHNGIFKGSKASILEGGIRVPGILRWPSNIRPDTEISLLTSLMDFFPTLHDILQIPLPSDISIDGRSILPLLQEKSTKSPHSVLFHFCGVQLQAATMPTSNGVFKLYNALPKFKPGTQECLTPVCQCFEPFIDTTGGPWLYNLSADPSEKNALSLNDMQNKNIADSIQKAMEAFLKQNYLPPSQYFNLFRYYPLPWQMACCNFPWCSCFDENSNV